MSKNTNLQQAKAAKADEFYTQLTDIEKELYHYKEHFKGKTVLCNCDDPRVSNFFRFFAMHFEDYGLKRLITTCYKNQDADLFSQGTADKAVYLIYEGDKNGNGLADPEELEVKPLKGDGDFRSAECIELLKQADIVVTNPPFSLFREYVAQLMKYEKKFLIIGNVGAITYKEIFPLLKDSKMWLGNGFQNGNAYFKIPDGQGKNYAKGVYNEESGLVHFRNCTWYTNMDFNKRHEPLILCQKYSEDKYPKYDNYDAIEVGKTADIPEDYYGVMGVPTTFLDKFCPEQFEILGITQRNDDPYKIKKYTKEQYKNANDLNARAVLIVNGEPKTMYARILIRRKQ